MLTLFISKLCPDTAPAMAELAKTDLKYEVIDITESMANMKKFLKYRDFDPFFKDAIAAGRVCVPVLMKGDGEKFTFFDENLDLDAFK